MLLPRMEGATEDLKAERPNWLENFLGTALILVASLLTVGLKVPFENELIYLTLLRHRADPTYLPGDWTFSAGFEEFFVWLNVFGPLTDVFGIEAVAWAGRLLTWAAIGWALLAIGRRLGARPLYSAIGVVLWLGLSQSMGVGATRVISEFQARSVSYALLLGALALALDKKVPWALLASGLAFAFHPGVGIWGSSALVISLLVLRETRFQSLRWIWLPALAALPGVIPQLLSFLEANMSAGDARFLALQKIPFHTDPFSFGVRGPVLLVLMLAFNLAFAWRWRTEFAHRLLGIFQVVGLIPVALGVIARVLGISSFLVLLPFRILPALAPILFLLNLAALASRRRLRELWPAGQPTRASLVPAVTGLLAIVGLLVIWNPVVGLASQVRENVQVARSPVSDVERTLAFVADQTPNDAVVLGPPARDDLFYLSERSQYVSWSAIPYDRIPEWRARLEDVMPSGFFVSGFRSTRIWEEEFAKVPQDQLAVLPIDYVVTKAVYDFPAVFAVGDWTVYEVAGS